MVFSGGGVSWSSNPFAAVWGADTPPTASTDTLGGWLEKHSKVEADLLKDQFVLRRATKDLLVARGIAEPTHAQLRETRHALVSAVRNGKGAQFVPTQSPSFIEVEGASDVPPSDAFFEREFIEESALKLSPLRASKAELRQLQRGFADGSLGRVIAGTFIDQSRRSRADFSHAYGAEAWDAYLSAWNHLDSIPRGALLDHLSVELLKEVNRRAHAPDKGGVARAFRAVGAFGRGRWDEGGRLREAPTVTRAYSFRDEEVEHLREAGVVFRGVPAMTQGWQRGVMEYAPPAGLEGQIARLIDRLVQGLAEPDADDVGLAADFCRRLVALHPFEESNGRTARLVMNRILMERGYPPAVISRQDEDLTLGPQGWRAEVARGIVHTKAFLERVASRPLDELLEREGICHEVNAGRAVVRVDGRAFRKGSDGFLYDVLGRPHVATDPDTLRPLSQVEYLLFARRLMWMGAAAGGAMLKASTEATAAMLDGEIDGVRVVDEASARASEASFALRPDPVILEWLVGGLGELEFSSPMFAVSGARGTDVSMVLSKYQQMDLDLWGLEQAARKTHAPRISTTIHEARARLFEAAKRELREAHPMTTEYERIMWEASPLRFDDLAEAVAAQGDDHITVWRADYAFAALIGMGPNNDPRQVSARDHTAAEAARGRQTRLYEDLKSLEQSGVGSRYLSTTSDLALLTSKFSNKTKTKTISLTSLPAVVRAPLMGMATGYSPGIVGSATWAVVEGARWVGAQMGLPSDMVEVVSTSTEAMKVKAKRKVFELKLSKRDVLPGLVASSLRHPFAHEQEIHGLVGVSPWSLGKIYEAQEIMTPLDAETSDETVGGEGGAVLSAEPGPQDETAANDVGDGLAPDLEPAAG